MNTNISIHSTELLSCTPREVEDAFNTLLRDLGRVTKSSTGIFSSHFEVVIDEWAMSQVRALALVRYVLTELNFPISSIIVIEGVTFPLKMENAPTINREVALQKLRKLGLPPIFERIWDEAGPEALKWLWVKPHHYFRSNQEVVNGCPRLQHCVPLLESNCDHVIVYDESNGEYLEHYYDDVTCEVIGKCYQQFISHIFLEFLDAGLRDEVNEISVDFQYEYLSELITFNNTGDFPTFDEYERAFMDSIPC